MGDGVTVPVIFYSRQLHDAERRFSATELEAQVMLATIMHYYHYLYGTEFTVITDHRPLTALFTSKTLNRRLIGIALKLSDFNKTIVYGKGSQNGNADGLSRQAWEVEQPDMSREKMDTLQKLQQQPDDLQVSETEVLPVLVSEVPDHARGQGKVLVRGNVGPPTGSPSP